MWKWIVGALLVLVVAVAAFCYVAVKKFTSGGDTVAVTVAAAPDRVFAALADPDSMTTWMMRGSVVTTSHPGILKAGDTLHVETGKPGSPLHKQFIWVVSEATLGKLLVLEMRDSTGVAVYATRRDSLIASGDSTRIVSTIAVPMMDSIKSERGDTGGKVGGVILDFGSKLMITTFRMQSEQELQQLKRHLEAKPAAPKP